ncbi:MAG: hypothetical protein IIA03_00870 [Proteobacteria bacterium]|nr:hypothetical protein [Pseudomonadota bacterium]
MAKPHGDFKFADVMQVGTLIFFFLFLFGLLQSLHKRESIVLLAVMVYFLLVAGAFFAESRQLLPIVPLYHLFAASALAMLARAALANVKPSDVLKRRRQEILQRRKEV